MKLPRPTAIGGIAGIIMILISLGIYYRRGQFENEAQYITYAFYMGAVIFGQYRLFGSGERQLTFRHFFSEGFRVFIIITLLMVAFTWIFLYLNPELRDQMALQLREDLIRAGNRTPSQIEAEVADAKKKYTTFFTSVAIFGYLMIGVLGSLIGSLFFTARINAQSGNRSTQK